MLWKKTSPDCGVDPKRYALKRGEGRCGPPLVSRLNIQFAVLSRLVNTTSGKGIFSLRGRSEIAACQSKYFDFAGI